MIICYYVIITLASFKAYTAFSQTVSQFSTLPLIIHNKATIFERLKEHIGHKDEYALESLFDLCAALALDLQVTLKLYILGKQIFFTVLAFCTVHCISSACC